MRIPPFYISQVYGTPSCSDPKYTTENTCKNQGNAVWGYYPPNAGTTYTHEEFKPDEHPQDFYYTGIHKMSFNVGPDPGFSYVGAYSPGGTYSSGDLVSYQGSAQGGFSYHPEKKFYAVRIHHNATHQPSASEPGGDPKFEPVSVKSYIYEGVGGALDPGAYHAYDWYQQKVERRYNEGAMATARKAEMGVTHVKVGKNFETWFNEENDPKQFYVADYGHFNIYETCHGTRPVYMHGLSGNYNFYNAAYPGGYYLPPYGERATLTLIGSSAKETTINAFGDGDFALENFMKGDCCKKIEFTEEMDMWGIRTVFVKKGAQVTFDHTRGEEHGIHAPYEECPPDLPPMYYFERELYGYHPGSVMAPNAGNFYNDNPFPNSLDIDGVFGAHVYHVQRCYQMEGGIYLGFKLKASFPEMVTPVAGSNEKKLDGGVCKARNCETTQMSQYNFQGVQGGMGTGPGSAVNDSASFATYDAFTYWHFIFQYNHESLWNQSQNTLTNEVTSFGEGAKVGFIEDHMWEYRQCPEAIDFLPYTADNPIHSCPSEYFDIPYYAAIGKFGFYGARFFNSCSKTEAIPSGAANVNQGRAYNYYTAQRANNDGSDFVGDVITLKGVADRTDSVNAILRINNGCYNVKFVKTSTEDEPVDLMINATGPSFAPLSETFDLKYDVLEIYTEAGFTMGGLALKETIVWGSQSVTATACEVCVNGGQAGVERARDELTAKLEAKFSKSMDEIKAMQACVRGHHGGGFVCDPTKANAVQACDCAPYMQHGSVGFKPEITIDNAFGQLDDILRTHAQTFSADNIHGTQGTYSTYASQVGLVRDWPAGVADCDVYKEPGVGGGVCDKNHYDHLLELASNEQRINEYFIGNQGFFLWANYDHIINSHEYKTYLTGLYPNDPAEVHFKRCLFRLKQDFDQILFSLPNFFSGTNDPVIYYDKPNAADGLYSNQALDFSRIGLFNDMVFTNNRYRRFKSELEWNEEVNLFNYSDAYQEDGLQKPNHTTQQRAWEILLEKYGRHISRRGGSINSSWYYKAIKAKETRILTRFIENKLRGKAVDLYPTNKISFSFDSASPYVTGKHWGNSKWGDNTAGHHKFDPLDGVENWNGGPNGDQPNPGVMRTYFNGVYANKASVTGYFSQITHAQQHGGTHYYAGLFQDFSCGGDRPMAKYNAGGIGVDVAGKGIPANPWVTQGHNEVGRVNKGFSCFSPIYTQQPLNVSCKIGQRPVFRAQAVDYHTIPEDKIGQGYPEIDYWTNSLKLTNSKGELEYPIQYQWYRILKKQDPRAKTYIKPDGLDQTFEEWFYEIEPILQRASITGEWSCMEGVSGVGWEDCTMFHPQVSYTHEMTEGYTEYLANGNQVDHPRYGLGGDGDRKYGADHWNGLVDYNGNFRGIGSVKKQGDHRLWKQWAYIQGAMTSIGKVARDGGGGVPDRQILLGPDKDGNPQDAIKVGGSDPYICSAIPIFDNREDKTYYDDVLKEKYGLESQWGDDDYMYFCVASGRFGFRRSEYANLDIEDWIKIDFSVRNGGGMSIPMTDISYNYTRVDQKADMMSNMDDPCQGSEPPEKDGLRPDAITTCIVPGGPENGGGRGEGMDQVNHFSSINLTMGFGSPVGTDYDWMRAGVIPPFAGVERDSSCMWENQVREKMNMSNNCRSFAFVGTEAYRGSTRTFKPPTQGNVQGTVSDYAGWFEYGLLYPFGTQLSQAEGNALYSQPQLPVCRGWFMPKGMTAQSFTARVALEKPLPLNPEATTTYENQCGEQIKLEGGDSLADTYLRNIGAVNLGKDGVVYTAKEGYDFKAALAAAPTFLYHYTAGDRAIICIDLEAGVPPSKFHHQGELYPYNDMDSQQMYDTMFTISHHGRGATWQFSNNLGVIKRFGKFVPMPDAVPHPSADNENIKVPLLGWSIPGTTSWAQSGRNVAAMPPTLEDTADVYFWAWARIPSMRKEFKAAKRHIWSTSLAGVNCGWTPFGCGRFMLYFVEAQQRYYLVCHQDGKKRTVNKSFIAPGLRHGASGVNYFTGGYPSSTYVKRKTLLGPYAYKWKVYPHNRDRNGNGIAESFYSTRYNRVMYLYDPPAIYGLWAKQHTSKHRDPRTKRLGKLRGKATKQTTKKTGHNWFTGRSQTRNVAIPGVTQRHNKLPVFIKGLLFGPPGMSKHGGCGSYRLGCVEAPHKKRKMFYYPKDAVCEWYITAMKHGMDHGNNYGCNEKQLKAGVCFDPCLSMKYNYGFFPGGKLLTINNYVKYRDSRHNAQPDLGRSGNAPGGAITDLSPRDDGVERRPPSGSTQHSSQKAAKATGEAIANPEDNSSSAAGGGSVYKPNSGARFMTQLTGDVADEETAISKGRSTKFVRILRGPWATPYRRIKKAQLVSLGVAKEVSSSDVINKQNTYLLGHTFAGTAKYLHPQNLLPNPKRALQVATETSVSPCNGYGADHCNYLTPTLHFGMDTQVMGMETTFGAGASLLAGGYNMSKELTVMGEVGAQVAAFSSFMMQNILVGATLVALSMVPGGVVASTVLSLTLGVPIGPGAALAQLGGGTVIMSALNAYLERMCPAGVEKHIKNGLMTTLEGMGFNTNPTVGTGLEIEVANRAANSSSGMAHEANANGVGEAYRNGELIVI